MADGQLELISEQKTRGFSNQELNHIVDKGYIEFIRVGQALREMWLRQSSYRSFDELIEDIGSEMSVDMELLIRGGIHDFNK